MINMSDLPVDKWWTSLKRAMFAVVIGVFVLGTLAGVVAVFLLK